MNKGMTALDLQDAIIDRVKKIFEHDSFQGPGGRKKLEVFSQSLPVESQSDDDADTDAAHTPSVIIAVESGEISDALSPQKVTVTMLICSYGKEKDRQGYRDGMIIRERIVSSIKENPIMSQAFDMQYPIKWENQENDTHPYYFSLIMIDWITAVPKQNNEAEEML